jgi:heptaprenylglyceryl phosphate synthase
VKKKPATNRRRHQAALLGLALDNDDGHKRITTGEDFAIVGGSAETHEKMTETVVKTFEELKRRRKPLVAVEPKELAEILDKSTPR